MEPVATVATPESIEALASTRVNEARANLVFHDDAIVSLLAQTCSVSAEPLVTPEHPTRIYRLSDSRRHAAIDSSWVCGSTALECETVIRVLLESATESPEILAARVERALEEVRKSQEEQKNQAQQGGKGSTPQQNAASAKVAQKQQSESGDSSGDEGDDSQQGDAGESGGASGASGAQGEGGSDGAGESGDAGDAWDPSAQYAHGDSFVAKDGTPLDREFQARLSAANVGGRLAGNSSNTGVKTAIQKLRVAFDTKRPIEKLVGTFEKKDDAYATRMLPNRRFANSCGWRPLHNPALLIALDISGSMSKEELRFGVSGIDKLTRDLPYRIDVVRFNSEVQGEPVEARRFLRDPFESGGGTSFQAIQEYTANSSYEALILVTDGEDTIMPKGSLRRDVPTVVVLVPGANERYKETFEELGYPVVRLNSL